MGKMFIKMEVKLKKWPSVRNADCMFEEDRGEMKLNQPGWQKLESQNFCP